ncbi:MAG TPA: hypothetical protein VMT28_15930 [Terriglobales bacterium]|jgi:hypothetical protein|nr:hypothetical protein [Terriglobales bacterium]
MNRNLYLPIAFLLLAGLLPGAAAGQSDSNDVSLGDLARALRKNKEAPKQTVIDNDNFAKFMDEMESRRLMSGNNLLFSFDGAGKTFQVSSPDVTCSLSFNAQASSLLSGSYVTQDLPDSELAKLDGPATINGDTLQLTVYNGSAWKVKEITVGLTILRRADVNTAFYGSAKLLPATVGPSPVSPEKRSDVTLLYHLKGTAAPFSTTVFTETLGANLGPDQDWHWAIVQAKGVPPPAEPPDMLQVPLQF